MHTQKSKYVVLKLVHIINRENPEIISQFGRKKITQLLRWHKFLSMLQFDFMITFNKISTFKCNSPHYFPVSKTINSKRRTRNNAGRALTGVDSQDPRPLPFCLLSSNAAASFNMSAASLCMSSLASATACM